MSSIDNFDWEQEFIGHHCQYYELHLIVYPLTGDFFSWRVECNAKAVSSGSAPSVEIAKRKAQEAANRFFNNPPMP